MFKFFKNSRILNKKVFALVFLCVVVFSQFLFVKSAVAVVYSTGQALRSTNGGEAFGTTGPPEEPPKSTGMDFSCSKWEIITCGTASISYNFIARGSAFILSLSGILFDKTFKYTVTDMKANTETGNYINPAWEVLRDIVNIMFIFVILYIGIMTIIKGTDFGTKRMLATVITVAILLNFSLFFTKIFVDLGNVISINIHKTLTGSIGEMPGGKAGIGGYIIGAMGFGTLYEISGSRGVDNTIVDMRHNQDWGGIILYSLFIAVILVSTAVVILIAAFMFLARFVIIIFLLIFSSAAVGSHILPQLKSQIWNKWFSTLIGQTFFAPAFLLLFLVAAIVINALSKTMSSGASTAWSSLWGFDPTQVGNAMLGVVIPFIIIMGFLLGAIIFSKKLSDMGSSYAGTLTKIMGGAALGATAFAGRRLGGIAGGAIKNSGAGQFLRDTKFDNKLANYTVGALARATGRSTIKSANKLQNSTFDVRNAGFGISKLINKTGVSLGDASKKTFVSDVKEKQAKIEKDREIIYSRTKEEKAALDDRLKTEAEDAALAQELDELANPLSTISDIENRRLAAETAQNASEIALSRALADLNRTLANPTSTEKEIEVAKHKYNTIKETHSKNESEFKNIVAEKEKYRKETLETNTNAVAIKQSTHEIESVSPITGLNIPGLNKINKFRSASFANSSAVQSAISAANKKLKQSDNDKVLEALKALGK